MLAVIEEQARELERLGDKVRDDILGNRSALRDAYAIKESIHSGEIEKVLRVYEPGLAPRLSSVIGHKTHLLRGLGAVFAENARGLSGGKLVLKEIVGVRRDVRFVTDADTLGQTLDFGDPEELFEFREHDLSRPDVRHQYISEARTRLRELDAGRLRLIDMLRKYYAPHDLL